MSIEVKVSFVTDQPTKQSCPSVKIISGEEEEYIVQFNDRSIKKTISVSACKVGQTVYGTRQWFTNWRIRVLNKAGEVLFIEDFDPTGKTVFIKIDAYALGDNLAWMPYVEEFRKMYNAQVICSTFFNNMFAPMYPEILFAKPDTHIKNIYSQYYIGANEEENMFYSPINSKKAPLQAVASTTLGMPYQEIVPRIPIPKNIQKGKYVCISEFASAEKKHWKAEDGWQQLVDHIISLGYEVKVISREKTELKRVIDQTGDFSLAYRISELAGATMFIGVSSGLSWVSWAVGTHVVMISDVTPSWHEFQNNVTRLQKNTKEMVNYEPTEPTTIEEVKVAVSDLLKAKSFI